MKRKRIAAYAVGLLTATAIFAAVPGAPGLITAQAHHGGNHRGSGCRSVSGTSYNGSWKNDGTGWCYETNGRHCEEGFTTIDGNRYCFDKNGYLCTGWVQDGDDWYYYNSEGNMVTGTSKIDGTYYCFQNNGTMMQGQHDSHGCGY